MEFAKHPININTCHPDMIGRHPAVNCLGPLSGMRHQDKREGGIVLMLYKPVLVVMWQQQNPALSGDVAAACMKSGMFNEHRPFQIHTLCLDSRTHWGHATAIRWVKPC